MRPSPPHFLLWGDSTIRVAKSDDLATWPSDGGVPLLKPRPGHFDDLIVEAGPPPLPLSDGNLLFFFNSANKTLAYHATWAVLSGADPTIVLQRSDVPLLTADHAFEAGTEPWECNVPNVVFLEAAVALGGDRFRVFFGGSDAVVGTAVVQVSVN